MDSEFLSDYSCKQREQEERIAGIDEIPVVKDVYRASYRRLDFPIARNAVFQSVWPQIPICGTLIISLMPWSSQYFGSCHGFDPSDIDRLVDFAKDTGRVGFVLEEDAMEYCDLDFLDPIFTEMKPPRDLVLHYFWDWDAYQKGLVEFDTLSRVKFYSHLRTGDIEVRMLGLLGPRGSPDTDVSLYARVFASLGVLGYDALRQTIADALIDDPEQARRLLGLLDILVVRPRTDPLDAVPFLGRDSLEESLRPAKLAPAAIHACEIGRFLMKKLAPYPESFEACRVMCDRYDHYDLDQIMNSLQKAIASGDYSDMESSAKNLSEGLDNVWRDASELGKKTAVVRAGVVLSFAVLGTAAGGIVGGAGGLLAGLGYAAGEKIVELKTDSVSERIVKSLTPNYLVNIFDFKQKYAMHDETKR